MKVYSHERLERLAAERGMPAEYLHELRVVSSVLPFKVNQYVVDELVDWSAVPDDPIFRLTFPHRDMLPPDMFETLSALHLAAASPGVIRKAARAAHALLNPNPGAQVDANVPVHEGSPLAGVQHKYAETVLVFPRRGRPATPTAGTASAGRSSSATPTSGRPRATSPGWSPTWPPVPRSPTSSSPAATP
ncbi:hypothetical protein ACFQ0M_04790 [Kitasatospora aburaviensis]